MSNTLTVLMSVYNAEKYLFDCIKSVLDQTYSDFTFLIFDDKSTDNSVEIINSFQDKRIKLIENDINKGLTYNLHHGLNIITSKYVARMDADDICLLDRFEKQIDFLNENKDISIVGSSVIFFNSETEFVGYQPEKHDEIKIELFLSYTMLHPSIMLRTIDFKSNNLNYDLNFKYSQDHDLWVRSIRKLNFANIKEPLIKMREHSEKITRNFNDKQKELSRKIRFSQLEELNIKFEFEEESLFNKFTEKDIGCIQKYQDLELIIKKLVNHNKLEKVFNTSEFNRFLKYRYGILFYENLKEGKKIGLNYWKNNYVNFYNLPIDLILKIYLFSTITLIQNNKK